MKAFTFIFIFFLSFSAVAQESDLSSEVIQSINDRIKEGLNPSIAIGIIDEDGTRYYSYGKTKENGKNVDEHSIYEIGSISKTFTGILLGKMVTDGQMNLTDPVEKYVPEGIKVPTYEDEKITLGHLSDHTSSLPRLPSNLNPADPSNPYADYSVKQMFDFLNQCELTRPIGSEYEYSNYAQGLLGHILAEQSGKSFEQLVIDAIAKPLGMKETKIVLDSKMKKNLAIGHSQGQEVSNWDLPTLAGAGAIRSSVHDMLIYLSANIGLTETSLQPAMKLSHTARHGKGGDGGVGLAWHLITAPNGEKFLAHNGGTGGYRTFAGFSQAQKKGVVVFTNSTEGADDIGHHLMYPDSKIKIIKPLVATRVRKAIDEQGIEKAVALYNDLKENHRADYDFNETDLNGLGYHYLGMKKINEAKHIFKMVIETFPTSSNAYDSYGEALMENGENKLSIENYKKSLELNPANTGAIAMLAKMGVEYEVADVQVSEDVLERLVGKYELQPSFHIEVTRSGKQLYGQATGQGKFELFPTSDLEYYLKVVEAKIKFTEEGDAIKSLTLFQGGQEMPGKKIE